MKDQQLKARWHMQKAYGLSSDGLNIPDFCDMQMFNQIIKDWANSTGLATVAVGRDGNYISGCYNFTHFCEGLTRTSPEGLRRCMQCDKEGRGIYLCHAGLVDFASPITLSDGTRLGNIVGGQVLPEQPDEDLFRATARELGIDEDEYVTALRKVNIRSNEEITASANLLTNVINLFVRTSYADFRNTERMSERAGIISSLSQIYFCNYYVHLADETFMELDATEGLHDLIGKSGDIEKLIAKLGGTLVNSQYVPVFSAFLDPATIRKRLDGKKSISFEFMARGLGWCKAVVIPCRRNVRGEVTHVIYALQDINDEKTRDIAIRQALRNTAKRANRANRAKTEFLSRMSHDIRTPMNGIIGMTRIAMEEQNSPRVADCLKKIDTSSSFLLGLINDVMDMASIESGKIRLKIEPYPLDEFSQYIDSVIRPLAAAKKQDLRISFDTVHEYVPLMDKLRTNQIVFNLLSNAIKYTPEGGTITYSTVQKMNNGKIEMQVCIADNGRGMSEEFQQVMFEPFTQEDWVRGMSDAGTRPAGTGLGLSIVHKLVTLAGGSITVKSQKGAGTAFYLHMPLEGIPVADFLDSRAREKSEGSPVLLQGKRILLCEDNTINQEIARHLLERYGLDVTVAGNGLEGKQAFEASPPGHYDAIFMDLRMPLMDGYETTRAIRALPRKDAGKIPIIAMTADSFEKDIRRCLASGMNGHIAKPIAPDRVVCVLNKFLSRQEETSAS